MNADGNDLEQVVNAAKSSVVVLTFRKETKHTLVYGTDDEAAFCSSVYISKASLPGRPNTIKLTMEVLGLADK